MISFKKHLIKKKYGEKLHCKMLWTIYFFEYPDAMCISGCCLCQPKPRMVWQRGITKPCPTRTKIQNKDSKKEVKEQGYHLLEISLPLPPQTNSHKVSMSWFEFLGLYNLQVTPCRSLPSDFDVREVNLSKVMDVREAGTSLPAPTHLAEWGKDIFILLPLPQTGLTEGHSQTKIAPLKCDHVIMEKKCSRRHKSKTTSTGL